MTLVLVVSMVSPAQAWDGFGHMVVASVAYRNLDSQTRKRVDKLLKRNPYYRTHWLTAIPAGTSSADRKRMIFMLAATWPDAIKSDPSYHNDGDQGGNRPTGPEASRNTGYDDFNRHKYWHFVDEPFRLDGGDVSSVQIPSPNAQTQIAVFRAVLESSDASADLKSYDLVWLLHIVGDVHQPLHCTTQVSDAHPDGDAGGNDVGFCTVGATKCTGELHAFWDDILGTGNSVASADKFAASLDAPSESPEDIADAGKWVSESFALAKADVYVAPVADGDGPFRATQDYTDAAKALAQKQVALAGARLSAVLEAGLKP